MYFYGCNTRDPWPPAEPDAQSFCPPPTDEDLHDLTQSPPSRICTDVEVEDFVEFEPYPSDTWREWDACTGYLKDCWMEGGGQYPIKLTIEKEIIWEKEIATCTTEYGKTEHFRVSPDTTTLPESLGVIGVDESSGSEPPAG